MNEETGNNSILDYPLPAFRFKVEFFVGSDANGPPKLLCGGAFSECTGIEATMEPRVIKEGGNNFGDHQKTGKVTFATVVLKRGVSANRDLWNWYNLVATGAYAYRLTAKITLHDFERDSNGSPVMSWTMRNALPTKFKAPDFNATSTQIAIEELHFVHEGLQHELIGASGSGR